MIVGALSLAGFAGGALLGSRLGPLLLEEGSLLARSPHPFLPVYLVAAHHGKVRLSIRSATSDRAEEAAALLRDIYSRLQLVCTVRILSAHAPSAPQD